MYKIRINNMKFYGHIGVYREEKTLGQKLEIDLEVQIKSEKLADELTETIDYGKIYQVVSQTVQENKVDLIESLASMILKKVKQLDSDKILASKIKIRKLAVPIEGIFDNVEIEMEL
ncbi:dihydroneopterin aldolase [Oenococcus sp. UCMA 17063]|nr:dihydroneopterin aldolase [Oenococcus sp. UCMA 17063]